VDVTCARGYSLLSFCALHNDIRAMEIISKLGVLQERNSEKIVEWANRRSDRGFTALHYAAYFGNLEMIDFLVKVLRVDIDAENELGQNALHFGAMGDRAATIVYFMKNSAMRISEPDSKRRTPLHWAIHSNSRKVLEYILAHP